jgi:cyclic pyranopterin phosphate synthase
MVPCQARGAAARAAQELFAIVTTIATGAISIGPGQPAVCRSFKGEPMSKSMKELSHFDAAGQAHMVDVGAKEPTERLARASGSITMAPATLALIQSGTAGKGDVLGVARIAAIQAAKRTSDLIPLCHNIPISSIRISFELLPERNCVVCTATVQTFAATGVEMEALTAVHVGLLTIYDMCKAVDRGMIMGDIGVREKRGGASGTWTA